MRTKIQKSKQRYLEQLIRFNLESLRLMRNKLRIHRSIEFCGRGYVDLRVDYRAGRMLIRLRPHSWRTLVISQKWQHFQWVWTMECPACLSSTDYLHLHADNGQINCGYCEVLPSLRRAAASNASNLRKKIKSGDLQTAAEHLQSGGSKAIQARQAMEFEGIADPMLVPEPMTRQFQIYGKRMIDPWAGIPKKPKIRMVYAGEVICKKE